MIKELISDLAYDKISLSQALTRSKLIALKIGNNNFREWLKKELEGYQKNDEYLPPFRKISCETFITHHLPDGQEHSKPVIVAASAPIDTYEEMNYCKIYEPISIIEKIFSNSNEVCHIKIAAEDAQNISNGDRFQHMVIGGFKKFGRNQIQHIIELTKQKLLDTLLELSNEFSDLENDFPMTKDNAEKIQNIITNNVYGNNNPLNIAAGQEVIQKGITVVYSPQEYQQLRDLGVEESKIEELKDIASEKDKATLKSKALKWLGSVSASVAARGLYDGIPTLTEFVNKLI